MATLYVTVAYIMLAVVFTFPFLTFHASLLFVCLHVQGGKDQYLPLEDDFSI